MLGTGGSDTLEFEPGDAEGIEPGFEVISPGYLGLSGAYQWDRGWIGGEFFMRHPLRNDAFQINRRFHWGVRVGARYRFDDNVSGGVGFFTDLSAAPEPTELRTNQVDFFGGTVGLELRTPHILGEGRTPTPWSSARRSRCATPSASVVPAACSSTPTT